jgi:uncharacterized protein (TIGR03000 family)
MHKILLLAGALGAALIFVQPAAAQHRHGGHSHGHSHGHHHHGHYHGGFGGFGGSFGHYGHHHHYPSYLYGGFYGSPYYSYSSPSYYTYPPASYQYASPAPSAPLVDPAPVADPTTAQIQVVLPNPDAELTFDGARTSSVGRVRLYHTPALDPSRSNSYRIGISWVQDGRAMTDARVVSVAPGRMSVVDFTQPATESVPLPK